MEEEIIEFDSIFDVLTTLAHQLGVEKEQFISKYDIIRSIYEKLAEKANETSTINEAVKLIYDLAINDKIQLAVKPNKLTYNGSIWRFERTPDVGEYVTGDLYVNNNKVGTYNGLICRNTLSGWEEGALAIESASFGNQAISLLKEDGGEWQIK